MSSVAAQTSPLSIRYTVVSCSGGREGQENDVHSFEQFAIVKGNTDHWIPGRSVGWGLQLLDQEDPSLLNLLKDHAKFFLVLLNVVCVHFLILF